MRRGLTAGTFLLATGLLLFGCGGNSATVADPTDGSEPPGDSAPSALDSNQPSSDEADTGGGAPPAAGDMGSYSVEGQTFDVTLLNRCPPFQDEPGNVDLQALSQGSLLNLYVADGGETLDVSVQGSAVQEAWGSIAFTLDGGPLDFSVTADRITGSATLVDAEGGGDSVDVTFDVAVPDEINDC
jgi:hypothetical protein